MKMISLFFLLALSFLVVGCKEVTYSTQPEEHQDVTYVTVFAEPVAQYVPQNVQRIKVATLKIDGDWSALDKNFLKFFRVIDSASSHIVYSVDEVVYNHSSNTGVDKSYTLISILASFSDFSPQKHVFTLVDINPNDAIYVLRQDIGVAYTTSYRLPHSPTVSLRTFQLSQNSKLGILRVTNVDLDRSIDLSKVTFTIDTQSTARGGLRFSGNLCLRDLGSSASCGGVGTTTAQSVTQAGGTFTVNISGSTLSNALNSLTKNGGFIEYEIYLENAPLWVTGDSVSIGVSSILYDPYNQSEYYIGVAGAQATATK